MVDLDQKVQESFAAGKGKGMVTKGPKGFLEGALLNREVAAAHDKFMADVEVRARGCGCFFPVFFFFKVCGAFFVPSRGGSWFSFLGIIWGPRVSLKVCSPPPAA